MIIGKRPLRGVALACSLLGAGIAWAQDPPAAPPGPEATLPPVTVTAPPPVASSSEQIIPGRDFELRPQGRPADVLRLVPGLIINQHQGGGKAEQYLIRGFDADHGTDLAIFVDGVPVNLRSHAHGQGYADLHFLIPETVQAVDVLKGPYFPEYGDFDTAGVVKFITRDFVEDNTLEIGGGSFNSQRYLALLSPTRDALKTLVAIEGYRNDGPFEHPNGYLRFNLFVKATTTIAEDMRLSVWGSHYRAEWHGSGEIPARAVRAGLIDRFGSIDPNEGGVTERTNLTLDYQWKVTDAQRLSFNTYVSYYTLSLFNDFTFFLDDPVNGDMINQRDRRFVAGLDAQYEIKSQPFGVPLISTAGLQYRIDTPHVVLANAIQRHQVRRVQEVDIVEQSVSPFVKLDLVPLDKVRFVTGARGDVFTFDVKERVNATGERLTGAATKSRPNVKANLIVGPWAETELFGNFGTGFHSNDARAVIANPKLEALPTATGYEFGFKSRIVPRTELFATYWFLDLGSELVFVGDDGTTEARGRSHREGLEVGAKIRLLDWLTFTGDFTYTAKAEFVDTGFAIPLAPLWTARADLTARLPWGLSSSLEMRYLGDRWADEFRYQTARGYTLFNSTTRYRFRNFEAFLTIENLTNVDWREAQFFFTSRLRGEPARGVDDIHFTPGTPRSFFGGIALHF
ncbi:MAG: TonB-dependent receptor [Candidatus Rokuibacteriota bacterium]|nr:MAG: TonB-dependent receptor [Candidatus Rokubacteria bacterium]